MKIYTIDTGFFKLDGGAMFGVVPKSMWQKKNTPDENNLCTWAMRCLLIDTGNQVILIDTGIGNKQDEKFMSHFHPHGNASLLGSIKDLGYKVEDITDVLLTHLHFDHCGGAIYKDELGELKTTFPKATYWSNEDHWNWALNPNPREKASFLKENMLPIQESGQLKFIPVPDNSIETLANPIPLFENISVGFSNCHTEALMVFYIDLGKEKLVYPADLMPSPHHIPMPWVMSYDIRPLQTLKEKEVFLPYIFENGYHIFFEHDPEVECGKLIETKKGYRFEGGKKLKEIL